MFRNALLCIAGKDEGDEVERIPGSEGCPAADMLVFLRVHRTACILKLPNYVVAHTVDLL